MAAGQKGPKNGPDGFPVPSSQPPWRWRRRGQLTSLHCFASHSLYHSFPPSFLFGVPRSLSRFLLSFPSTFGTICPAAPGRRRMKGPFGYGSRFRTIEGGPFRANCKSPRNALTPKTPSGAFRATFSSQLSIRRRAHSSQLVPPSKVKQIQRCRRFWDMTVGPRKAIFNRFWVLCQRIARGGGGGRSFLEVEVLLHHLNTARK